MSKAILWIIGCVFVGLCGMSLLSSCAWFQKNDFGINQEKVNSCADQCLVEYVHGIDSVVDVSNKEELSKAAVSFSNCMFQCMDMGNIIFDYITNKLDNSKELRLRSK